MERTISQEERIRRAEEIYNRRYENRNNYYTNSHSNSRKEKNISETIKQRMAKKMVMQMLICVIIYGMVYVIQHSNQLFSENILEKTKEILAYDISFDNLYGKISEYFNNIQNNMNIKFNENLINNDISNTQDSNQENGLQQNLEDDSQNNLEDTNNINTEEQAAIGGSDEILPMQERTQEEMDIDYVKNNINIIWPLVGTITSRFGTRTPTEIVSANHYGTDIAGNIGDTIISAIDGTVTLSAEEEGYGKYIKIENGEVSTIYAHCSKLIAEEGTTVVQGQKIAEVGATRKSNWASFTF